MNITDYFPNYEEVGFTKKTYGVKGQLRLHIDDAFTISIANARHVFFLLKGCLVPYFIEHFDEGVIKFESCNNPEDAKKIVGKVIYLKNDQIIIDRNQKEADSFAIVNGFDLFDSNSENFVGKIEDVVRYPQQEIAILGEIMIPLNFENVKGIDLESQKIYVDIPEGLLDINS